MDLYFKNKEEDEIVILLLSDLHFTLTNINGKSKKNINPLLCLSELSKKIENIIELEPYWRPKIIVVAGDLTHRNEKCGFELLKDYLKKSNLSSFFSKFGLNELQLLGKLKLDKFKTLKSVLENDLLYLFCPGNHDLTREFGASSFYEFIEDVRTKKEKNLKSLNDIINYFLNNPNTPYNSSRFFIFLKIRFREYINFLEEFYEKKIVSIKSLTKLAKVEVLINNSLSSEDGKNQKLRLFSFNTSLFCAIQGESITDNGNLFVGVKQIEDLKLNGNYQKDIIISVMHHPWYFLNWNEWNQSENNSNLAFNRIASYSHIILCGHEHGPVNNYRLENHNCIVINNGVSYDESPNMTLSFTLISINSTEKLLKTRVFNYIQRNNTWEWIEMFIQNRTFEILV